MTTDLPFHNEQPVNSAVAPRKDRVRWIVAFHLVGVVVCLMLTLADSGLLFNHQVSRWFYATAEWPFLLGLLTLPVCPLMMLCEIVRDGVKPRSKVLGVIAEILLRVAQVFVLLPSVQ